MTTLEQLLCNRALARLLPGWWRSSAELVESARGGMFADARQLHELRSLRPAAARCSLPVPSCARVLACRVQLTPAPVPSCIRFAGYRCFSVTTPLTRRQASTLKVRPPHTSGRVSWCASCCSRPGSVRASDERACLCTRTARGARHTAHGTRHTARYSETVPHDYRSVNYQMEDTPGGENAPFRGFGYNGKVPLGFSGGEGPTEDSSKQGPLHCEVESPSRPARRVPLRPCC